MKKIFILLLIAVWILSNEVSAAHFIVGRVNDSIGGVSANGKIVLLWNQQESINDNITDIIGVDGNSGADNVFMIDCEMLREPCQIGENMSLKVIDGNGYSSITVNVSVTGAGYDIADDMILNEYPKMIYMEVEDDMTYPDSEIDLLAGDSKRVYCYGLFYDLENDSLIQASAEFFDSKSSYYGDGNDNNTHYANNSCSLSLNHSSNQSLINCSFDVLYYANSDQWNCSLRVWDGVNANKIYSNDTFINKLLSISVPDSIDFGSMNVSSVSEEKQLNVTNFGNTKINLALEGYAFTPGDGFAMNCSSGFLRNISIHNQKYNLTKSNPGNLDISQFESLYVNLTNFSVAKKFDLNYRQNEVINDAMNATYWRIYVPNGIAGSCSGKIIFGAVQVEE